MKKLFTIIIKILLLFLLVSDITAQSHDIRNEIMNYQSRDQLELINRSRRMLQEKFEEGDIQKVKEIKDYLLNESSFKNYMPLYFNERFIIYF